MTEAALAQHLQARKHRRCITAHHAQHPRRRLSWQHRHGCWDRHADSAMIAHTFNVQGLKLTRQLSYPACHCQHGASPVWAASHSPESSTPSGQPGSPCWPAGSSTSAHGPAAARPQSSAAHSPWRWRWLPAGAVSHVCGGRNTQLPPPWAAGSMSSRAASHACTIRSPCMDLCFNDTGQVRPPHLHCCMARCGAVHLVNPPCAS